MKCEKIDKDTAIHLALTELNKHSTKYTVDDLLDGIYVTKRRCSDGSRKGWSFAVKLDVPGTFEPNMFFIRVSDPNGTVDIIDAL